MNKKAQVLDHPIVTFIIIIFGLLFVGIVVLKVMNSIQTPMSNAFGNVSGGGAVAQANFNTVMNTGITFWDKVIVAAFALSIILMFVSAFFIDAHPFFIILYIFICFMLVLFAPSVLSSLDTIYNSSDFAAESAQLSFLNSLRENFSVFLVGIMVITGIIIYGKYAFFAGRQR